MEDNAVNQMVITRILTNYGCKVTPAHNGLEAVTIYKLEEFDLIFMDCMMPEMDGYEATKIIIAYEKTEGRKHTPIIAFTANAMKGDDKKCLEAGMDDYMSKPVHPDMMIDVMTRWLPDHGETKVQLAKMEKAKKDQIKGPTTLGNLIDPEILDALKSLTGDSYVAVLESYIKMASNAEGVISKSIQTRDADTLRREANSLKSSSRQIGAMQVGDMAAEMEKRVLEGHFDEISDAFPHFSALCKQVVFQLRGRIEFYNQTQEALLKQGAIRR